MLIEEPQVEEIVVPQGEVSDEVDYFVNNTLMQERGPGYTACQPALVRFSDGQVAIRMGIDATFVDADTNEVMGYGIVGYLYLSYDESDPTDVELLYIAPNDVLEANLEELVDSVDPTPRPKGKY
jgi:hypothetical protein